MVETEEQKKMREEKERQEEIEKRKKFEEETKYLIEQNDIIKMTFYSEIKCIESTIKLRCDSIIFDSDICDWSIGTSTFDKRILNRKQLAFVIETESEKTFGYFINAEIDKTETIIEDKNAWVREFADQICRYCR